jgi:RecA-family ATPase
VGDPATLAQTNEQVEAEPASVPMFDVDEPEPMQWRVADFVPEDHLTMLVADGGTGKSILAVHLSLCIATGRPFFGMNTRRGRVLYIDHELDRDEQLRRMYKVARGMGVDLRSESVRDRLWYLNPVHALGTAEHQNTVLHDVERRSIDLVVLDSLTMGAAGDVADVADVVPIMQDIRQWPTTVAIDHVSHSTARGSAASARAFGSVFKRNAARSSLTLAQADTGGFALQQEKSNFSQGDGRLTYAVEWMDDRIVFERISDADERAAGLLSDLSTREVTLAAVTDMYEATGGAVHPSDVIAWRDEREEGSSQVSKEKTVQNHFTALKKQGKIVTDKHGAALPASAEHQIPTDAPEDDAPF